MTTGTLIKCTQPQHPISNVLYFRRHYKLARSCNENVSGTLVTFYFYFLFLR
jgi:hypothetical protein